MKRLYPADQSGLEESGKQAEEKVTTNCNYWGKVTELLNFISIVMFIGGYTFLFLFIILNLIIEYSDKLVCFVH